MHWNVYILDFRVVNRCHTCCIDRFLNNHGHVLMATTVWKRPLWCRLMEKDHLNRRSLSPDAQILTAKCINNYHILMIPCLYFNRHPASLSWWFSNVKFVDMVNVSKITFRPHSTLRTFVVALSYSSYLSTLFHHSVLIMFIEDL